jgi:hypothetical protein
MRMKQIVQILALTCLTGCATVQNGSTVAKLKATVLPVLDVRQADVREGLRTIADAATPLGITIEFSQVDAYLATEAAQWHAAHPNATTVPRGAYGSAVTVAVPDKSIYEAMDILCTVADLSHRIEGNTVTITVDKR